MRINVNELLISLSRTLDFAEKGVLRNNYNHGMRVAYIAGRIANALSMPDEDVFDLISFSLLHDNGVMKALLESPSREKFNTETNPTHCVEGEKNIAAFPFLNRKKDVILYHHEHYDGSGFFGVSGREIPLYSRVILLADRVAIQYASGYTSDQIVEQINREARIFDPVVRAAFVEMSRYVEFWLGMDDMFVQTSLVAMLPKVSREMDFQKIRTISQIFSNIIDAKSPFTGSHSRGISEKVGTICRYYEFDDTSYWKMRIAADLHDIGKLAVPNEILDKPGKLNGKEFRVIQSHPFYTRKILEMINGFEDITNWASNHHEKLDGSGYPYGIGENKLDFNSRILACVDIYQALTEDRPYRRGMAHKDAVQIMEKMAQNHLIESAVVEDINSIFQA
ncbi:MAG: Cyclic di-GMP phosphodiesterase response regulator RpfG [Clostridium sp.]